MDNKNPIITINGNQIELPPIKARTWREIMQYETQRKDHQIFTVDDVDKHCGIIALAFGVTAEEVLDNIDIADVIPTYYAVLRRIAAMLTEKLVVNKKNELETAEN